MPGDLFWELYQQRGIIDAGAEAAQARTRTGFVEREVVALQTKVDRLFIQSRTKGTSSLSSGARHNS